MTDKLDNLVPLIVPREYFTYGNWPGPYRLLKHHALAVTWVVLEPEQVMTYLTNEAAGTWLKDGINYEYRALENLQRITGEHLATHHNVDSDGNLLYLVMMHEDGVGSSRMLLHESLAELFPEGYWMAIPERSCAFVIPKQTAAKELAAVKGLIRRCWEGGTTPMLSGLLALEDLQFESTN